MRSIITGAGIVLLLGFSVHAAEILTGRIISVNHKDQSLVIEPVQPDTPHPALTPVRAGRHRVRPAPVTVPAERIQVSIPREAQPPRVLRGRLIRAFGDYEETSGCFNARQIDFSDYPGPDGDPTGVRRRLGQRCGHGRAAGGRPCGR
jgi:hypothetical protein